MSEQKTHWKRYCNPNYLGAYSLDPGQDLIVTIAQVGREMVKGEGGRDEECTVAHFREKKVGKVAVKPMILNRTNCKIITALYATPYVEEWAGKAIQVYAATTTLKKEKVECLRIRPLIPQNQKPELTPKHPKWPGAVRSYGDGSIGLEGIRQHFDLSDENAELLMQEAANA